MNTLVGMQASFHTPREDSLRDLMKNEGEAAMNTFDDDVILHDDFNADELLMSPLFNDSGEKLESSFYNENDFGQFDDPQDTLLRGTNNTLMASVGDSETVKRPVRPTIVRESRTVKFPPSSSGMSAMHGALHGTMGQTSSFIGFNTGVAVPLVVSGADATVDSFRDGPPQMTDDSSHFDQSQSEMQDYSTQSYRSPTGRIPDRSLSTTSSYQSEATESPVIRTSSPNMFQRNHHQSMPPGRAVPLKAQSYAGPGLHMGAQSNDLSMMRQQLQRMRDLEIQESLQLGRRPSDSNNLSQSMHVTPVQRTVSASATLSRSMHYGDQTHNAMHGMSGVPPFGNVSIASETHSFKPSFNNQGGGTSNVNEAMEKLCESMKRSAMSRCLVKQFSSGRGVSRQGSGQLYAMRQGAARNGAMDDSSGRSAPIRRLSNAKHHLQHQNRGVYRHDSGRSLGNSAHSINLQIDGRNIGAL